MKKNLIMLSIALVVLVLSVYVFVNNNMIAYTKILPYASELPRDEMKPFVDELSAKLHSVKSNSQIKYQIVFGPGFFEKYMIGQKFDYGFGVHLGKIQVDQKNKSESAKQLLARMDEFSKEFYDVFNQEKDPAVSIDITSSVYDKKNNLNRDYTQKVLEESLGQVLLKDDYQLSYKSNDNKKEYAPVKFKKDELFVINYPKIKLFSNALKTANSKYAGIRQISLWPSFYCDLEYLNSDGSKEVLKNVLINTEIQKGAILPLREYVFSKNLFVAKESGKFLKKFDVINNEDVFANESLSYIKDMLASSKLLSSTEYGRFRAVDRLNKAYNVSSFMLTDEEKTKFDNFFANITNNAAIKLLDDIYTLSGTTFSILRNRTLYDLYSKSGDLDKQLKYLIYIVEKVQKDLPAYDFALGNIHEYLSRVQKELSSAAPDLEKIREEFTPVLSMSAYVLSGLVSESELKEMISLLEPKLVEAGFRPIDIYFIDELHGVIYKNDLKKYYDVAPDNIAAVLESESLPAIDFSYIEKESSDNKYYKSIYWLRPNPTEKENQNYKALLNKLKQEKTLYNPKTSLEFISKN